MLRRVAVLWFLLCPACSCAPTETLDVTVIGASAVERTPEGDRFWFDAPEAPGLSTPTSSDELQLEWDPGGLAQVTQTRQLGSRTVVLLQRPPAGARTLEIRAGQRARKLRFVFRASPRSITDVLEALARTDPPAARKALAALPPHEWPWGCVGLARGASPEDRPGAYAACAQGALERGFVTEAISRNLAALYWARRLRQYTRARAIIEQTQRALVNFPDARLASQFHYQQGVFLSETGDLRRAETVLRQAISESAAALRPDEAVLYRAYLSVVLSEQGRHAEALVEGGALEGLPTPSLSPGDRLAIRTNLSWVKLRALLHGAAHAAALADSLRDELERLSAQALADDETLEASNTLSNLAWLEFSLGRLGPARSALERARTHAGNVPTGEAVFLDWLAGRLFLSSGDADAAVSAFEAMLQRASLAAEHAPESTWRAHLGLAEARLLQGRPADAVRALGEARRALSSQARGFVDPAQRVLFLEDRRSSIAGAVEAFASAGRCDLAWRLAEDGQTWLARSLEADRRVRLAQLAPEARAAFEVEEERWASAREGVLAEGPPSLASVAELETWRARRAATLADLRERGARLAQSLEASAPLANRANFEPGSLRRDEALFEVFRTSASQRVFLVNRAGVTACGTDAAKLLTPARLQGVRHLFVVDGGARLSPALLRAVISEATISFVPSAALLAQAPAPTRGVPLVVGDPRFDLPAARAEARAVATLLKAELLEGDGATLDALLARWSGRPLLHFAGHGRLSPGAPWDARLELASGQTLDFELLLSRRPAPGLVVLSGCETGAAHHAPADGVGLAEGFLAGGTNHVLATTAEVGDDSARAFIERFYRLGGLATPSSAFRLAVLEADAAGDDSWKEWKLLGRRSSAPHD